MSKRATSGVCRCVKDWIHYPFINGVRSTIPDRTYYKGDIYNFEYHKDEALYSLYRDNEKRLCNWAFFDDMFEIIG